MVSNKTIVLTGPTAVGKTELVRNLLATDLPLARVITTTTRPMRSGEVEDVSYHFVDKPTFEDLIKENKLLEWTLHNDHYYGIQISDFDKIAQSGKVAIASMDIPGALRMKQTNPTATTFFIAPDSFDIVKRRLIARGLPAGEIESRLQIASREMESANDFDHLLVNRDGQFEQTLSQLVELIRDRLKEEST